MVRYVLNQPEHHKKPYLPACRPCLPAGWQAGKDFETNIYLNGTIKRCQDYVPCKELVALRDYEDYRATPLVEADRK